MPLAEPLPIVLYPDPFLNQKARNLTDAEWASGQAGGWNLAELVERMKATMYDAEGIGLAAPQVGVGLRLFLMDISENRDAAIAVFNPELLDMEGAEDAEEGCLSIPEVRASVKRAQSLKLKARDLRGEPFELSAQDLLARVIQHENDHLDGILFITKIGMAAKFMQRRKLAALEDDYALLKRRKSKGK